MDGIIVYVFVAAILTSVAILFVPSNVLANQPSSNSRNRPPVAKIGESAERSRLPPLTDPADYTTSS